MATTQMLSIDETAIVLSVHPQTVRAMIKRGELAAVKVARHWRVSERVLDQITTAPNEKTVTRPTEASTPETRAAAILAALDGTDMKRRNAAIIQLAKSDAQTAQIVTDAAAKAVEDYDGPEDDFSDWQAIGGKPRFSEEAPDYLDGLYRADKADQKENA